MILFFVFSVPSIRAQQVPLFSLYRDIPLFYNPAAAGISGATKLFVNYRQQWAGFNNAPEAFLMGIEGRFNEKMGAALTLHNDITDIYGQLGGYGYYSYRVKLHKEHILYLGLSAGFKQNRIYFEKIKANDPLESNILENTEAVTRFDAGAGVAYNFKKLHVYISA
ncbi:MAG TPA: PorP/SprF family type IX secretion system membrane protein, partial [Bacteroidales bacterium]|nr:PorP/SprF family type IX secretion system membrane protein [Bacteroidales bacterium]